MPKALLLSVYSNPHYRRCANGGITETEDQIYMLCNDGPFDVDENDPKLFKLGKTFDSIHLEPVNRPDDGRIGPMMGGSYAGSSDSRFSDTCSKLLGHSFYGAVAVHDRYETPQQYEALSR